MNTAYPNPVVHNGDPISSVEAAREMDASGARACHAKAVLWLVKQYPDSTAIELGEHSELGEYQIRRRLTDLKAAGLIAQGDSRACRVRGTTMVVWRATSSGWPGAEPGGPRNHQSQLFD